MERGKNAVHTLHGDSLAKEEHLRMADKVPDMEVDMVADMAVDMVADMVADIGVEKVDDK